MIASYLPRWLRELPAWPAGLLALGTMLSGFVALSVALEPCVEQARAEAYEVLRTPPEEPARPAPALLARVPPSLDGVPAPGLELQWELDDAPEAVSTPRLQAFVRPYQEALRLLEVSAPGPMDLHDLSLSQALGLARAGYMQGIVRRRQGDRPGAFRSARGLLHLGSARLPLDDAPTVEGVVKATIYGFGADLLEELLAEGPAPEAGLAPLLDSLLAVEPLAGELFAFAREVERDSSDLRHPEELMEGTPDLHLGILVIRPWLQIEEIAHWREVRRLALAIQRLEEGDAVDLTPRIPSSMGIATILAEDLSDRLPEARELEARLARLRHELR